MKKHESKKTPKKRAAPLDMKSVEFHDIPKRPKFTRGSNAVKQTNPSRLRSGNSSKKELSGRQIWKMVLERTYQTTQDLYRLGFRFHETAIEQGAQVSALKSFAYQWDIDKKSMAKILGLSERTLDRLYADDKSTLTPVASDRLFRTAEVLRHAFSVFREQEHARKWLHSTILALGNEKPLNLLSTDPGATLVDDTLGRLEHGIVS